MENIIYNYLLGEGYKVDVGSITHYQKDSDSKTTRSTLEVDFVCNKGSERLYIQSGYSLPDEEKMRQEQRSLTLTDDSFAKMILTTDNIPTHTTDNGIMIMNVFEYLLKQVYDTTLEACSVLMPGAYKMRCNNSFWGQCSCVGVPSVDAISPEHIPVGGVPHLPIRHQVAKRRGYENKLSKVTSLWTMPE